MALQLSGSINLGGDLTIGSGSITVLTGSIDAPNNIYTLFFADMEINHTSGSRSFFAGVGIPFTASVFGAGLTSDQTLVLQPTASAPYPIYSTFKSLWRNAKVIGYSMYTNITGSDVPAYDFNSNGPTVAYSNIGRVYKDSENGATSGQVIQNLIYGGAGDFSVMSNGAVKSTPIQILDAGTLYISEKLPNNPIDLSPTEWSPKYFTFLMSIGAAFPTKTYKFRFELEIEDNGLPVV